MWLALANKMWGGIRCATAAGEFYEDYCVPFLSTTRSAMFQGVGRPSVWLSAWKHGGVILWLFQCDQGLVFCHCNPMRFLCPLHYNLIPPTCACYWKSGEQGESNLGSFIDLSVRQNVTVMYGVYYCRGNVHCMHILGKQTWPYGQGRPSW